MITEAMDRRPDGFPQLYPAIAFVIAAGLIVFVWPVSAMFFEWPFFSPTWHQVLGIDFGVGAALIAKAIWRPDSDGIKHRRRGKPHRPFSTHAISNAGNVIGAFALALTILSLLVHESVVRGPSTDSWLAFQLILYGTSLYGAWVVWAVLIAAFWALWEGDADAWLCLRITGVGMSLYLPIILCGIALELTGAGSSAEARLAAFAVLVSGIEIVAVGIVAALLATGMRRPFVGVPLVLTILPLLMLGTVRYMLNRIPL